MNPIRPYTLRGIKSTQGGILITTVLLIVIMTMMSAAILYRVSSRHAATYMSVVWNEALSSAEAGTDFAVQTLNNSIASPGTAWTGWTPGDATTFPKTINFNPASHIGESNTKVFAKLTVDNTITDGSGAHTLSYDASGQLKDEDYTTGLLNTLGLDYYLLRSKDLRAVFHHDLYFLPGITRLAKRNNGV